MKNRADTTNPALLEIYRGVARLPLIQDYGELNIGGELERALCRAAAAEFAHTMPSTKSRAFLSLKHFAKFLRESQATTLPLRPETASAFAIWLAESPLDVTAQSYYTNVIRLLAWCQRNIPGVIHPKATFPAKEIRTRRHYFVESHLDGDRLKSILSACYEEIEVAEEKMAKGQRIVRCRPISEPEMLQATLAGELFVIGDGKFPSQRQIQEHRENYPLERCLEEHGGYEKFAALLYPVSSDMFPFYLAILAQVSGNTSDVLRMEQDCIRPHPIRSDIERIWWDKVRAGKEQHADFPIGREWSAPSLARRYRAATQGLPPLELYDAGLLFVCYCTTWRKVRVPSLTHLHKRLDEFVERHGIVDFTFKDLRPAGAQQHHKAGGSIIAAKERLNHASVTTTSLYTSAELLAEEHKQTMLHYQGEFVRLGETSSASPTQSEAAPTAGQDPPEGKAVADTVFGFSCKDPFGGIAPGSKKGYACLEFFRCSTCPGALVTLDDPVVVAKLLGTRDALQDAEKRALVEGWIARFDILYRPTQNVLEQEVLPRIPDVLLKSVVPFPMPLLE